MVYLVLIEPQFQNRKTSNFPPPMLNQQLHAAAHPSQVQVQLHLLDMPLYSLEKDARGCRLKKVFKKAASGQILQMCMEQNNKNSE